MLKIIIVYIKIGWNPACPVGGLLVHFNLAHKQIRFLSGEAFSLSACLNWEMGNYTLISFLHVIPKTPITH